MTTVLLSVEHVDVRYGAVPAIRDLSLEVGQGEIVTILGANGAGKTTTLRMISGLHRAFAGTVHFDGNDITSAPAHRLVELGLSHVPEGRRIFATMSVTENLEMGAFRRKGNYREEFEHIFSIFPVLGERRKQLGGTLSGGEQQMLAIGRSLMGNPTLLLVDEPTEGLAPLMVKEVRNVLFEINQAGVSILLVEHNLKVALSLAHRVYLMGKAHIGFDGTVEELKDNRKARERYLEV